MTTGTPATHRTPRFKRTLALLNSGLVHVAGALFPFYLKAPDTTQDRDAAVSSRTEILPSHTPMRLVRSSKQTTGTLKLFSGSAGIPRQDSPAANWGAQSPSRRRHGGGGGVGLLQPLELSAFASPGSLAFCPACCSHRCLPLRNPLGPRSDPLLLPSPPSVTGAAWLCPLRRRLLPAFVPPSLACPLPSPPQIGRASCRERV